MCNRALTLRKCATCFYWTSWGLDSRKGWGICHLLSADHYDPKNRETSPLVDVTVTCHEEKDVEVDTREEFYCGAWEEKDEYKSKG